MTSVSTHSPTRLLRAPIVRVQLACIVTSLAAHGAILGLLGWMAISLPGDAAPGRIVLLASPLQLPPLEVALDAVAIEVPSGLPLESALMDMPAQLPEAPQIESPWPGQTAPAVQTTTHEATRPSDPIVPQVRDHFTAGGGYEGRTAQARAQLAAARGGTPQSESAVELGLAWLVAHQQADGSWRFAHRLATCPHSCRHSGTAHSTTGATALALLPLLGAGNTHRQGDHAAAVERGLAYLVGQMHETPWGGDLQEGTMYAQGLAAIALCEAHAMSGDRALERPAQQALDFIAYSQHAGGGWRYFPKQPGDTTVFGMQLMALKSGRLAGLAISDETLRRAALFLDQVQSEGGAAYGYQQPGAEPSPTAIGLLSRMYFGAARTDERLRGGIDRLVAWGPSYDDMYFNFYATQVMSHYDGPRWQAWNLQLREQLVARQATTGHDRGSWYFPDSHTLPGGKLCDTALALLTLEVYYRHLPLYGPASHERF
jgi:hypothetical protein